MWYEMAVCSVRRVRASSPSASATAGAGGPDRGVRAQVRHTGDRADAGGEPRHPAGGQPHEKLSDHELKTLVMITSDERLSDITANLMLSPKTMSVYRAYVLEELQLAKNSELMVYAIPNRLVGG
jgi:DNA-binding NarL/FixJ family response regulator